VLLKLRGSTDVGLLLKVTVFAVFAANVASESVTTTTSLPSAATAAGSDRDLARIPPRPTYLRHATTEPTVTPSSTTAPDLADTGHVRLAHDGVSTAPEMRPASMPASSSACRCHHFLDGQTVALPDAVSRRLSGHHSNPPRDAYLRQPPQCHVHHTPCTAGKNLGST
jgi:hypothetical protein